MRSDSSDKKLSSESHLVTHPSKAGNYSLADWRYEHVTWGDRLKHRHGNLRFKGKLIVHPMGTVIQTPLGRFMSFENLRGGQVGYNTGWLMTVFFHDSEKSNGVAPVFLPDNSVNPKVLQQLPIEDTDVTVLEIEEIAKQ